MRYFINHANVSMFYAIDIIDYFIEKELITNYDKKEILFLINKHYDLYDIDECDIINKFWKFGFDYFLDLFILVLADNYGRIASDNKRMENLDNISFAEIGTLITVVCMLIPFYYSYFATLPLIYGDMNFISLFLKSTIEIAKLLLGNGIIRLIFVVLTPISVYTTIKEN